jgi:hypothetical protein
LSPEQDRLYGDRPAAEVVHINEQSAKMGRPLFPIPPDQTEAMRDTTHAIERVLGLIRSARSQSELNAAVEFGRQLKAQYLQKYPHLAQMWPDIAGLGQQIQRESAAAAQAEARRKAQAQWQSDFKDAQRELRQALAGTDAFMLRIAVDHYNDVIRRGQALGISEQPLDLRTVLLNWYKARSSAIAAVEADRQSKVLQLAKLRQDLAAATQSEPTAARTIGPYRIQNFYDRRGQLTKQLIVDTRTGLVVSTELLRDRAQAGDEAAAAILGKPGEFPDLANMSAAELYNERNAMQMSLMRPDISVRERSAIRRRIQEIDRQLAQRYKLPGEVPPPPPERKRLLDRIIAQWRATGQPIPRQTWEQLKQEDLLYLLSNGVALQR